MSTFPEERRMDTKDVRGEPIGFVGIGAMGFAVARNVLESGFEVAACDLRREALDAFTQVGGEAVQDLPSLARRCRSVHLVVVDDEQIEAVAHGDDGLIAGFDAVDEDRYLVVHSSVRPETPRSLAEETPEHVTVIDAAMSGAQPAAEAGELTFIVGGDEAAVEYCRPVLEAASAQIYHVGDLGTGMAGKIANNTTSMSNVMTTLEGLRLGEAHGIDRETLLAIFRDSSANSFIVENWEFLTEEFGEVHPQGFEGNAEICEKDLYLGLALAKGTDVDLSGAGVASQKVPAFWRSLAASE